MSSHWRELVFGFATTFLSGFGQTFFVALFLVPLVDAIGISQGRFGLIYSTATLAAGLCLPLFGRWLDARTERAACLVAGAGLTSALLLFASATSLWALGLALFGLRAFGQGGMALISMTAMARHFEARKGIALGISGLGFPSSEMILPTFTLFAMGLIGWRQSALLYALILAVAVGAIRWGLLTLPLQGEPSAREVAPQVPPTRERFTWWRDCFFLLATGTSLIMPFAGTVTLLYLVPISKAKGWPVDWVAAGFAAFAVVRAIVSLVVGSLIDRWGAQRLFPWSLAPGCLAIAVLAFSSNPSGGLVFFVLLGVGFGAGSVLTALFVEVYGRRHIGEIRGLATSAAVLSSALGPFASGLAMEQGWSFHAILAGLLVLSVASLLGSLIVPSLGDKRITREEAAALPGGGGL